MEQEELLNTKETAACFRVDANTIRRSLCVNGHYLGIKPKKLPNGRLLWNAVEIRKIREAA